MHNNTISMSCEIENEKTHFLISKDLLLKLEDKLGEISFDYDEEGECYNNDENIELLTKLQDEVFSQVNAPKEVIREKEENEKDGK